MANPPNMNETDQQKLDAVLAASPHMSALADHVRSFAAMMCDRRGHEVEAWMTAVDADDQPALRSFIRGLRRDLDAVTAGLTLPWSSGIVEGHVNRLKMLKRQMFGRAKPDLLRTASCSSTDRTGQITEPCQNQNSRAVDRAVTCPARGQRLGVQVLA